MMLSEDEVRALHRLAGTWLPGFLVPGDEADPLIDSVALRGLAARGWLALDGENACPAPPLTDLAAAFDNATLAVEIVTHEAESAFSRGATGAEALLEYRPYGLVQCTLWPSVPGEAVSVIGQASGIGLVTAAANGTRWAVDADVYAECDELAEAGDEDEAAEALIAVGTPVHLAKAWVAALCHRRAAASVTAVRRDVHNGRLVAAEVRWLVDEMGGGWRIRSGPDGHVLAPVDSAGLWQALAEMCEGER